MSQRNPRYRGASEPAVAEGWQLERLTPPSRLFGANGLRTGPDGRVYVAQVAGSQISAIDVDSGEIETISPMGGDIVAPDDLAFDDAGNIFATEITEGRVSVLRPDGVARVINAEMPCANPITVHRGRLFAGECRPGGRIMELYPDGAPPRIILENVPMPNAMEVVARELGVPDSVKFGPDGFIVSTQVASGQVLRVDPRTGDKTVLADIAPGLDNLTFVGERLFVSSISGQINEIVAPGQVRSLVPDGLQWPLGLAADDAGTLFIADGGFTYTLAPGESPRCVGMLFSPGFPGYTRGVAAAGPGEWVVSTANGAIARFRPAEQASDVLASGFDRLMGVAVAGDGAVYFAEHGSGKVFAMKSGEAETIAGGLADPAGVALDAQGNCYVAEAAAGRVCRVAGGKCETVLDGLHAPHGLLVCGETLYVVDAGAKELVEYDLRSAARRSIAGGLPVGAPPGVVAKPLHAIGNLSGPMLSFTGVARGPDGTLYVSGDTEGSVLALRRE